MWQVAPKVLEEHILNGTYCTRVALFSFSFVEAAATVFLHKELQLCLKVNNNLAFKWKKREWHFIGCNFKTYLFSFTFYKMCWHNICVLSTYSLKSILRFPALGLFLAVVYGIPYNFFFLHKMTAVLCYIRMKVQKWESSNFFCLFFMQWQVQFLMNRGKIRHWSVV